jgi:hypothetical protein
MRQGPNENLLKEVNRGVEAAASPRNIRPRSAADLLPSPLVVYQNPLTSGDNARRQLWNVHARRRSRHEHLDPACVRVHPTLQETLRIRVRDVTSRIKETIYHLDKNLRLT